jgi:hypothetical protein
MRRIEIAQRLAFFARVAERRGNHRKAAELFAAALQALLRRSNPAPGESAPEAEDGPREQARASAVLPASAATVTEERGGPDGTAKAGSSRDAIEGTTG